MSDTRFSAKSAIFGTIVAGLLHQAVSAVGEVTGVELGTDLIDRIFSRHCIGK
jgi:tRNA U34 5-carboxymethylaminomethyl modifying GTPase MnmE/TrmE